MSEFGRDYFIQEVSIRQIVETNRAINSKGNHGKLVARRKIEDFQIAKSHHISVTELNHGGVYQ